MPSTVPSKKVTWKKGEQINEKENQSTDKDDKNDKAAKQRNGIKRGAAGHEAPIRSNSEPDFAMKTKSTNQHYNVCILCTPEKKFFMKNLELQLIKLGYSCKVFSLSDEQIPIMESDAIVCCLSWRFSRSSIAAKEVSKAEKLHKPIIPLLSDNIEYPPSGPLRVSMSKLVHVDCSMMKINAKWEGREQTEDILDRLETYIANEATLKHRAAASSKEKPAARKQTNIPRAANSIWREKPNLPIDPLAREASEIRIMIRPPTPVRRDVSNIPLPERLINHSDNEEEEEDGDHEVEEDGVDDSNDSSYDSAADDDIVSGDEGAADKTKQKNVVSQRNQSSNGVNQRNQSNDVSQRNQSDDRPDSSGSDESTGSRASSAASDDTTEINAMEDERKRRLEKVNKLPQLPDAKRKLEQTNNYASVGSGTNAKSGNSVNKSNGNNQTTKLPSVYAKNGKK